MIVNTELEYKGDLYPSKIINHKKEVDSVLFYTDNDVILKLTVLRDSLLRFRYTTKGYFSADFSYAIDENHSRGFNKFEVSESEELFIVRTRKLEVHIGKNDLRTGIYDVAGNPLLEDELGFHWEESYEFGGNIVKMSRFLKTARASMAWAIKPRTSI